MQLQKPFAILTLFLAPALAGVSFSQGQVLRRESNTWPASQNVYVGSSASTCFDPSSGDTCCDTGGNSNPYLWRCQKNGLRSCLVLTKFRCLGICNSGCFCSTDQNVVYSCPSVRSSSPIAYVNTCAVFFGFSQKIDYHRAAMRSSSLHVS